MNNTLAIVVTRNNPILLNEFFHSFHNRTYLKPPCDLIIADNSSDDINQLNLLKRISDSNSKNIKIMTCPNDRVEVTFDYVSKQYIEDYSNFIFFHDDSEFFSCFWLQDYIKKITTGVGRVSACHQPYRDFLTCEGYSMPSLFLKEILEIYGINIEKYKYSDIDRTLYTQDCLRECGIWNVKYFKDNSHEIEKIKHILDKYLPYYDEGTYPKNLYPSGYYWNKLSLLCEFLNCVIPLSKGFKTVGLDDKDYLEQRDGDNIPFGSKSILHWGAPHVKKYLASKMETTAEEIHKKIYSNDKIFHMKSLKLIKDYYK